MDIIYWNRIKRKFWKGQLYKGYSFLEGEKYG